MFYHIHLAKWWPGSHLSFLHYTPHLLPPKTLLRDTLVSVSYWITQNESESRLRPPCINLAVPPHPVQALQKGSRTPAANSRKTMGHRWCTEDSWSIMVFIREKEPERIRDRCRRTEMEREREIGEKGRERRGRRGGRGVNTEWWMKQSTKQRGKPIKGHSVVLYVPCGSHNTHHKSSTPTIMAANSHTHTHKLCKHTNN